MDLYKVSKDIITNNCAKYKKYKKDGSMESVDIMTMLASSKLRVSLKHLQVVINWHNVQEFEVDWDSELPMDQWDACIEYCFNDVLSLKAVCETLSKDFELRKFVQNTTGILCHSKDPVKIAEYTMAQAIAESKGLDTDSFIWDTVESNVPVREITIGDLILPFISFKTDTFKKVLDTYKNFVLRPEEERAKSKNEKFKLPVVHNGMYLNFGLGGLHHDYQRSLTIKPPVGCKLIQSDVTSYYPSMRIEHLSHRFDPAFLTEYKKAYAEKAEGKATGNKMLEGYAKLKLNSVYGLYNSVYSPLYAPEVAYGTAINGQLMLGMLIESLSEAGFKVVGANTDAVNVIVPDARWDEYIEICAEWEKVTSMSLDHDEFTAIYEHSCNHYIATIPGGYVKAKGNFVSDQNLLKGYEHPIVKKALIKYFTEGEPIEKTITECDNIYDFCISTRMGKSKTTGMAFEAYHNGVKLQRTNRYYAAVGPNAAYLYKSAGGTMSHVLKSSGVIILNKYEEMDMKDRSVNYSFYIKAAEEIRRAIEPEQMSLW
jgi:hypothetical protein